MSTEGTLMVALGAAAVGVAIGWHMRHQKRALQRLTPGPAMGGGPIVPKSVAPVFGLHMDLTDAEDSGPRECLAAGAC